MSDELVPLADAIAALREELVRARTQGADEDVRFEVQSAEVEFNLILTSEDKLSGKAKFGVLGIGAELGADAAATNQRVHKVKIVLRPAARGPDGDSELYIASSNPERGA